jgi:ribosomal protein S18 acetylase RimI-like enzyme
MTIRPAYSEELEEVLALVKAAIQHMENQGIHQWDDIYPDRSTLLADLHSGHIHLAVMHDHIVGMIAINEDQSPEYRTVRWKYPGRALVVHRLTIDPFHERQGLASQLMRFAEGLAAARGYDTIRLDAFTKNLGAVALYEHLGYRKAGAVPFRKGTFYCYEKQVDGARKIG